MLRNGASIFAVLKKVGMAACQVYSLKDYSDADYKQLYLFHKLGGVACAELAHRTQGLPSIDATHHYIQAEPFHASLKKPTQAEIQANLNISYPRAIENSSKPTKGFQIQVDKIKTESRMRWNSSTNTIMGMCWPHSGPFSLEFVSMAQPEALLQGLADKRVHFACEVQDLVMW